MDIESVLKHIKSEYESTIKSASFDGNPRTDGHEAKEALIKSQRLIKYLHECVKSEFIKVGVDPGKIVPKLNSNESEISIEGYFKPKNQDICIVTNRSDIKQESSIEKFIIVNVRSQLSSLGNNIDTLHERTFAEALNLHLKYPKLCLGEVYLIPTHEYDNKTMHENRVSFRVVNSIERYIRIFQAINCRFEPNGDEYKYERVCLLIVDFRAKQPKIYSDIKELIRGNLVPPRTDVNMKGLTFNCFAEDLIKIYGKRFNKKNLLKA